MCGCSAHGGSEPYKESDLRVELALLRRVGVPKLVKVVIGIALGYGLLVFSFEVLLGVFQPQAGSVLTITTTGSDGVPNERVLAWLDDSVGGVLHGPHPSAAVAKSAHQSLNQLGLSGVGVACDPDGDRRAALGPKSRSA